MSDISIWDYIKMLSSTKEIPDFNEEFNKNYNPFLVNRFFSLTGEANIIVINELNTSQQLGKREHFLFLHALVPKSKRFNKWPKRQKEDKINLLMEIYDCTYEKARAFEDLITDENLEVMAARQNTGGADIIKKERKVKQNAKN